MHTVHHALITLFEPQLGDASPAADKPVSEFGDAEWSLTAYSCDVLRVGLALSSRQPRSGRSSARDPSSLSVSLCPPATQMVRGSSSPPVQRRAIADTLTATLRSAYGVAPASPVERFMSLYPVSGRAVSASGGRMTTTRESLEAGSRSFWELVGRTMKDPTGTAAFARRAGR